jgi:hypothetical protein
MSSMLEVPTEMVGELRSALHSLIQAPAEGIAEVVDLADHEEHPKWYLKYFVRLDRVLALLDVIGWRGADHLAEVRIDLCEHRWALLRAIEVIALVAADELDELDEVDAERARRGEPPKRSATLKRASVVSEFSWATIVRIARLDAQGETSL